MKKYFFLISIFFSLNCKPWWEQDNNQKNVQNTKPQEQTVSQESQNSNKNKKEENIGGREDINRNNNEREEAENRREKRERKRENQRFERNQGERREENNKPAPRKSNYQRLYKNFKPKKKSQDKPPKKILTKKEKAIKSINDLSQTFASIEEYINSLSENDKNFLDENIKKVKKYLPDIKENMLKIITALNGNESDLFLLT